MIRVNGDILEELCDNYWKEDYLEWIKTLSTNTLLEWLGINYPFIKDFYNAYSSIEYWFIGGEKFCEITYILDTNKIYVFVITDDSKLYYHGSDYCIDEYIYYYINKKNILRDLVLNKIV